MEYPSGRPNEIQDWLVKQKLGNWFSFSNPDVRTYANLIILDGSTKPSESEINAGLKAMQDAWDAQEYARKRANEYPSVVDQLDLIYHSGIDAWKSKINETKNKYPKP